MAHIAPSFFHCVVLTLETGAYTLPIETKVLLNFVWGNFLIADHPDKVIIAVLGVPGAIIGGLLIEVPVLGRRGTLAIATVLNVRHSARYGR